MAELWEPSFQVYMARIEGRPASFVVDLNAHRLETHPLRVQVRVPLKSPTDEGLRGREEYDAMGDVEDSIVERLELSLESVYVGRFISEGATTFVFYAPESARSKLDGIAHLVGDLGQYTLQWRSEDDAEWKFFTEFLYPDPYSLQGILNRVLLEQLQEQGDVFGVPREVDHLARFDSREHAESAAVALRAAGFRVDALSAIDERGSYSLPFHRKDALSDGKADDFVVEILKIILPLHGDYDGWGCPVVRN